VKRDRIESLVELHEDSKYMGDRAKGFIELTKGTRYQLDHHEFRKSMILMKTIEVLTGDHISFLRDRGETE